MRVQVTLQGFEPRTSASAVSLASCGFQLYLVDVCFKLKTSKKGCFCPFFKRKFKRNQGEKVRKSRCFILKLGQKCTQILDRFDSFRLKTEWENHFFGGVGNCLRINFSFSNFLPSSVKMNFFNVIFRLS